MSIETARRVFRIEAEAVSRLIDRIGPEFERAEQLILDAPGRVIVTGLGKSGIIGRKIAATMSSIGIPAYFLHPVEGAHGDIGMAMRGDVAIVISKSGATEELNAILGHLKRIGVPIIAMTGGASSTLAQAADVVLDIGVDCEACPFNIVPTASTTVTLAMGDALAISLFERKGLTEADFAALHPGGSIGRKLTYRVGDLMAGGDRLPVVDVALAMSAVIDVMSAKKLGVAMVTDKGSLAGLITDGDLRRLLQRAGNPLAITAGEALTLSSREGGERHAPLTVDRDAFAAVAVNLMEKHVVTTLVVTDPSGAPVGLIRWLDMSRAGVV